MRVSAQTDIGRLRAENQDNFRLCNNNNGLAWSILCDGMGGGQNGKQASLLAADCVDQYFEDNLNAELSADEVQEVMEEAVAKANTRVFMYSREGEMLMGTTIVCAVVHNGVLHLAHAGDSRAYIFEVDTLKLLTRDHSVVQELVEQGALSQEDAHKHPEKNVITRCVGVDRALELEYGRGGISPGATLLLCSDGLTNMLSNERIAEVMAQNDFYTVADILVREALAAGGTDNITVALMQIEEDDLNE